MREVLSLTGREFFHHDCKRDNYQRLNFARMVLVFKIKSSDCSQQMMMDTTLTTEFYVSSKKCKYGWYLQVFDATVTIKNRLGMTHKRISWSDLHGHEVYWGRDMHTPAKTATKAEGATRRTLTPLWGTVKTTTPTVLQQWILDSPPTCEAPSVVNVTVSEFARWSRRFLEGMRNLLYDTSWNR